MLYVVSRDGIVQFARSERLNAYGYVVADENPSKYAIVEYSNLRGVGGAWIYTEIPKIHTTFICGDMDWTETFPEK